MLAYIAVEEFPQAWPTFFSDVVGDSSGPALEMFLLVLDALSQFMVERIIVTSDAQAERAAVVKDTLRDHAIPYIAVRAVVLIFGKGGGGGGRGARFLTSCIPASQDIWHHILTVHIDSPLAETCLDIFAKYIDWVCFSALKTTTVSLPSDKLTSILLSSVHSGGHQCDSTLALPRHPLPSPPGTETDCALSRIRPRPAP